MKAWDRANKAYKLVYGIGNPPCPYTEEDGVSACEMCVRAHFSILYTAPNTNPITRKHKTLEDLLEAFNKAYPLDESA